MGKINFTKPRLDRFRCPRDKKQAFLWDSDAPGLGVRTTPNGKPSFIFQGPYRGTDVRVTIGSAKAWSIPLAREKARELQRLIDQGRDPRDLKREADAEHARRIAEEARRELKVADVWADYMANGKPKRKDAWKPGYKASMLNMALPGGEPKKRGKGLTRVGPLFPLMQLPMVDITQDRVAQWFQEEARSGRVQAQRALTMFQGFLRWCSSRPEYRDVTSADATKSAAIQQELPRKKIRTDSVEASQVKDWWRSVESLGNKTASVYLRALVLTGARREELAKLTWAQVDFRWLKLTIADKVEDSRTIPLPVYLSSLLESLPRAGPYVFAADSASGRISDVRASLKRAMVEAGIGRLSPHGLRRTFSILGEAAGAPAGAIAQIMGHKPSATAEGYRPRSIDGLQPYMQQIEDHILDLAEVQGRQSDEERRRYEKALRVSAQILKRAARVQ
jgi:integrase